MHCTVQRRLAADVMGCSPKKVWFNPAYLDKIKEAITKADIRNLVIGGVIQQKVDAIRSRGRARERASQRKKGRQKGVGTRKGNKTARTPTKRMWINRIRLQRTTLKDLKASGQVSQETYRTMYMKAKGGFFRSKRHLGMFLEENNLMLKNRKSKSTTEQ